MTLWQLLEFLQKPTRTGFINKDHTQEKLNTLRIIAVEGTSQIIFALIPLLKDENAQIRDAAYHTIIHLFRKIDSKKSHYEALKDCRIVQSDIDFYEANFTEQQFTELLIISSLNGNGYSREKAIIKLSEIQKPRAIKFIIYRLADWVAPIRETAVKAIRQYLSFDYIETLIDNLSVIEWLKSVERIDLTDIYQEIIEFLASTNRAYLLDNFSKFHEMPRLILAKHISANLQNRSAELTLLLNDKHFLIRNLALDHFQMLDNDQINKLLHDKSAHIRLRTLYCLKDTIEFKSILIDFLADESANIRHLARFTLKNSSINFPDFYNQNQQEGKQIIGSISGLAEMDAKQYAGAIKKYLDSKSNKFRKSAFLSIQKLDNNSALEFALANIANAQIELKNLIIDFLAKNPTNEVLKKARELYIIGSEEEKKMMLKLFHKIGGWVVIADLILGTIDQNEHIREISLEYLQTWKNKAIRLFSSPNQDDFLRIRQIFDFAREMHNEKHFFDSNPLDGLDFYFKK